MKKFKRIVSSLLAAAIASSALVITMPGTTAVAAVGDYVTVDDAGYVTNVNWPDVYPLDMLEVEADGVIEWKIDALINGYNGFPGLTDEEKFDMLSGDTDSLKGYGTGYWKGVARVGIPVIRMYDGPMGVRANTGQETTRPTNETSLASTFDKEAAYEYGLLYGEENKANSGNNQLGAQNDLITKLSRGRARDMFGEDWYLSGTITAAMSLGLQDENVMTCLKHLGGTGNIDEQTLHENQLSSTEIAMKEGNATAVMTNYETVNGVNACSDPYLLKSVLRDMWNYQYIVLTDWGGNYSFTVDDGVTIETPRGTHNNSAAIQAALADGTITMDDVNQAVYYNLKAIAAVGYLGLVYVGQNGVASDDDAPAVIELPDVLVGEEREEMLNRNNAKVIELAEKGAVLLKNDNVLPLADTSDNNIALIGFGSTHLVAGHMHECSFGSLRGLSVAPYDALSASMSNANVENYVTQDIVGEAVPAEYLFQDEAATEAGAVRVGTDGYGNAVDTVDADINFVTNSNNYKNAADGTAFEYGDQGHSYTWTTYLKAPESGTYTLNVQAIAAPSISANIVVNDATATLGAAGGTTNQGSFGTTGLTTTKTGMGIPTGNKTFTFEEGKTYKITITANGAYADNYSYQRGVKDMQVRLAWITPSQVEDNYSSAIAAAGTANTNVVLFAHSIDNVTALDASQTAMLNEAVAAAKAAGNKITLVLSTPLPVDVNAWVDDVDAILQMWLPGQGGGTAISNLLTGATSPSGKLSLTWLVDFSQDQSELNPRGRGLAAGEPTSSRITYTDVKEGIFNGYKFYDATDTQDNVLYDFGYGLSYTDFEYELVSVEEAVTGIDTYGFDVTVKVTNTGTAAASDAPQIYIGAADLENGVYNPYDVADSWHYVYGARDDADETDVATANYFPEIEGVQQVPYQLVGYERTKVLANGESDTVTIHVNQRALSYWDVSLDNFYVRSDGTKDKYTVIEGERDLYIAKSSDELLIKQTVTVEDGGSTTPPDPDEGANKDTLERVIAYAEAQMQLDDYKYVVKDVKDKFEAALSSAKAVYADPKATQAETYDAWTELLKWTQALSMQSGDKTLLLEAIGAAGTINLDNFVSAGQDEFTAAFASAKEVYNQTLVTQEVITAATNRLVDAMLALRLKADKAILDSLLQYAKSIDTSPYTKESVAAFTLALTASEEVMATGLSEEEQPIVDNSVIQLQKAIDGLTKPIPTNNNGGGDSKTDNGGNTDTTGNTGSATSTASANKSPKTGESAAPWMVLTIALMASVLLVGKKRFFNK